ncbi:RING finger protein 113A [Heracleum sosnowskyi]|uniref:RING finger protein 113A n=1 Tax=Heracleum sosnowskyi TaxID=360622 RepID=A0AAD8HWX6_9APIA|nr:RING finger protein 113A [Heracleum sosnowskyi]
MVNPEGTKMVRNQNQMEIKQEDEASDKKAEIWKLHKIYQTLPVLDNRSQIFRNYFRQTARNQNTRRRDRSEDNEVVEDVGSVIGTNLFKKKKSLASDGKLHFSTAPTKRLMTWVGETEREHTLFQFESSSEIQVQNDSRATTTLETETELRSDARARRERVLKQAEAALKGENTSGGDDKLYKGINAYVDHKAGFRREQTVADHRL